jgi:glycosyltransferase involved in cell wall biosynthesis
MTPPVPEVTIVTATRDRWPLLRRALRSALSQQDVRLEVMVVDDASREPPPPWTQSLPAAVNLVRRERHAGVAAARNVGIARARGEWVAFLDDDDIYAPSRLATLLREAERAGAAFACSSAVVVDEGLRPRAIERAPDASTLAERMLERNAIPGGGSGVVARTQLLRECGGFDERFSWVADWELWLRLARAGTAAAVAEPLLAYRLHALAWDISAIRQDVARLMRKYPDLGAHLDGAHLDHLLAHRLWLFGHSRAASRAYLRAALRHGKPSDLARSVRAFIAPATAIRLRLAPRSESPDPEWLAACRKEVCGGTFRDRPCRASPSNSDAMGRDAQPRSRDD